jgi:hypothetical protein
LHTKGLVVSIIPQTPITTVRQHTSGKIGCELNCKPPCAGNRTRNNRTVSHV